MANVSKVLFGALIAVSTLYGADVKRNTTTGTSTVPGTTTGTAAVPAPGSIFGGIDIRPGYRGTVGSFNNEDFAQVGYRFSNGNSVYYRQEFTTNLYNPSGNQGLAGVLNHGSLRAKINNIWQDKSTGTSFSVEPRLYLPVDYQKRDSGFITSARNYFKIKQSLSRTSYIQLSDSPVLHVYSRRNGFYKGKPSANPFVENRLLLDGEVQLFIPGLTLYLPLEWQAVHFHDVSGMGNSHAWHHFLSFWPELTYPVAQNVRVGVAFRTESMINVNFTRLNIGDAFRLGTTQLILNASL